ncbi:MAG TPA: rhomboid family intramembrane serine protease [Gemmatimonadaceae bacterium]|jgi:membrane associated rhomboid family serine protease
MIPLGDDLGTRRPPVMTYLILATLFGVWIFVQGAGVNEVQLATSICNLGLVPGEITHMARLGTAVPLGNGMACVVDNEPINLLTPLLSMFLHGGWVHLLGNCLFFWVFGNNIEDSMGHVRFLVFYLVCGLAAAAAQVISQPVSPVPTVGASGAISGILGAYLVLYPRARVRMLFFVFVVSIPAWAVLLWWFGWQLLAGLPELMNVRPDVSSGVAVWAHIGGFVTGLILVKFFENPRLVARRSVPG